MEERLCKAVERLECATTVLDRIIGVDAPIAHSKTKILAREADHRIKNSLQTVIALLNSQARQAKAEEVREALTIAGARVTAVAQVHATLHAAGERSGLLSEIDLRDHLSSLCHALGDALGIDGDNRILRVDVMPLAVVPETAQSIGLAVTELVINAMRHAFSPEKSGQCE